MSGLIMYGKDGEIQTLSETEKRIGRANNVVVSIRGKPGTMTRWHVVMMAATPGELTVDTANISHLIEVLKIARAEAGRQNKQIDGRLPRFWERGRP